MIDFCVSLYSRPRTSRDLELSTSLLTPDLSHRLFMLELNQDPTVRRKPGSALVQTA